MSLLPLPSYKKGSSGHTSIKPPPPPPSPPSQVIALNFIIDHPIHDEVDSVYGTSTTNSNSDNSSSDSSSTLNSSSSLQLDKDLAHATAIFEDSIWTNHGIYM